MKFACSYNISETFCEYCRVLTIIKFIINYIFNKSGYKCNRAMLRKMLYEFKIIICLNPAISFRSVV